MTRHNRQPRRMRDGRAAPFVTASAAPFTALALRRVHGGHAATLSSGRPAAPVAGPEVGGGETLRFGHFELHPAERSLRVRGEPAVLGGRAFDLLLALAQRPGQLVTKQELLDIVWPGRVVEEHNIATHIGTLRKLLGAQAIATVAGRGYRLALRRVDAADAITARPQLPRELLSLLGSGDDLAGLAALLQRCRLVTVAGAGVGLLVTLDNVGAAPAFRRRRRSCG